MDVPDNVQRAMAETNARFCDDVLGKQQFDAVSGVYTAAARILPPGEAMIEGRAAVAEFWKVAVEGLGVTGATLKTLFAEMAGDSVVEIGEASLALKTGDPMAVKYVVHWKQEDGQWLWDKDIWNLS